MSQENVELAYLASDAFNRRDLDAFLALTDPGVEAHSRIVELEGGGPYRGHDGIRRWWKDVFAIVPDLSHKIEEVRDVGDVTVVRVRQRGRGLESDAPIEQTQWFVTKWRDKKALWWRVLLSEADALEAAGLRE
ncbi:MAG: nuclear transport factor 2 family protein [Actinomycetota bacterium]